MSVSYAGPSFPRRSPSNPLLQRQEVSVGALPLLACGRDMGMTSHRSQCSTNTSRLNLCTRLRGEVAPIPVKGGKPKLASVSLR